ncbi:hypothetical protein HWV62_40330 [Athelia sp. TMB]|nr:hypothetical protein HWV62_40330 [Athelia sp. TMB]
MSNSTTPSPASATQSSVQASSTDSSGSGGGGSPGGLGGSSTLYSTLVLLLGVSGAIVVRSYVLRRRHQALVEEAIRNGTWVPPTFNAGGRRGRRDVGEKPTMWDAWVGKDREVVDADSGKGAGVGGWSDLLPISAMYLNQRPSTTRTTSAETVNARGHTQPPRGTRALFPWRRAATPAPSPPSTPVVSPTPATSALNLDSTGTAPAAPTLRLTVLIAMPAPPTASQHSHHDEEDGPPVIELGVVDVGIPGDEAVDGPAA